MTHTRAVVAETRERARWIRDAFSLDKWTWDCLSVDDESDPRFERIILLASFARVSAVANKIRSWLKPGHEDGLIVF